MIRPAPHKALSVRQPWAHLIVTGVKTIENRNWTTPYRGRLFIHAGKQWEAEPIEDIERRLMLDPIPRDLPMGGIVGIVDLVDIVTQSDDPFFVGPSGWKLANARALPFVPIPGQYRLFELTIEFGLPAHADEWG